jgi:hypothetical protein
LSQPKLNSAYWPARRGYCAEIPWPAGAVKYCGTIYIFGGESQTENESLSSVLRLDLKNVAWKPVSAMPAVRNFARTVLWGMPSMSSAEARRPEAATRPREVRSSSDFTPAARHSRGRSDHSFARTALLVRLK